MFSDPEKNIAQLALASGMQVADFGSGSGFYSMAAARAVQPSGQVFAVDIQKDLLQKLKNGAKQNHLNNINIVWGDLEHLGGTKLRENSMDAVIAANIFFQVENKDAMCLEIKRILRPLGRCLVIDWSGSFGGMGPVEKDVVYKEKITEIFGEHGLKLDREIAAGPQHYGLVFRKVV
jgi:ubiquinone/menaquinone biosynthesis C-methylase UbiE